MALGLKDEKEGAGWRPGRGEDVWEVWGWKEAAECRVGGDRRAGELASSGGKCAGPCRPPEELGFILSATGGCWAVLSKRVWFDWQD